MKRTLSIPDYSAFLTAVKERILHARTSAARAVNHELVLLYWDIGRGIVEKQRTAGWGDAVVERLAADLRTEFPDMQGFSAANIWRIRQFYESYSCEDFLAQAARELGLTMTRHNQTVILARTARELLAAIPWWHHVELLAKVKLPEARLYYLRATAQFGWSRNVLLNQIKACAYERAVKAKKSHNFPLALPENFAEQAVEMMKSSYNLEFLGIAGAVKERELEVRLVAELQRFILELGYGFCFIGRQYRLALGRKEYFVDLLFYHRFLKALVAFDLKIGPFEPEHSGKMDFYLNLLNDRERSPDDQPSIGIILCAEKDDVEVEFALKTKQNPIGVAEYQLQSRLPAEYKGRLPSAQQLSEAVRKAVKTKNLEGMK
ncbi:MAG: DUF1016 domain-containing protein [Candidatus Hydrogenedens sp.]|nr:DUF1016 domain-containing protein [Candidatus Hydrogenedens sp.]